MPPIMLNFSDRPPKNKKENFEILPADRQTSPREKEKGKHYRNATVEVRATADRWLEYLGISLGKIDKEGEMVEFGVSSHHRARSIANLSYLKALEESRPKWPHSLDHSIVEQAAVKYQRGFNL